MRRQLRNLLLQLHIKWLYRKSKAAKELFPSGKVLIVAPHPDDEVMGCGGLIARLVSAGQVPNIIILTGGEGSHAACCQISSSDIIKNRRELTRKALGILGEPETHVYELNYPDGGILKEDEETNKLISLIKEINPDCIFVPHWGEGWRDHVFTKKIVEEISPREAVIYEYCVWLWYYLVWTGFDKHNIFRVKMSDEEHDLKLKAMDVYLSPLAPCGKPWSGVLPPQLIKAHMQDMELYFKIQ